jgi:hypothetical protein
VARVETLKAEDILGARRGDDHGKVKEWKGEAGREGVLKALRKQGESHIFFSERDRSDYASGTSLPRAEHHQLRRRHRLIASPPIVNAFHETSALNPWDSARACR